MYGRLYSNQATFTRLLKEMGLHKFTEGIILLAESLLLMMKNKS